MPNNQIKTNQAEVTATAAQQVASDLPGVFRLRIEDGFFLATVKMVLNCCLIVFQVGPHLWCFSSFSLDGD